MDHLVFFSDRNILIFLTQLLVILILAKVLALPLRQLRLPTFPAELLVGIIIGPTILGRFSPDLFKSLFPADAVQHHMLDTMGWIGILFILLVTGMQVNLSSAYRQRRELGIAGVLTGLISLGLGFLSAFLIPANFFPTSPELLVMARLVVGTSIGVVAMPISLRILSDLGILKSDLGVLGAGSLSIVDILGWICLTFLLSAIEDSSQGIVPLISSIALIIALAIFAIGLGLIISRKISLRQKQILDRLSGDGLGLMIVVGIAMGIASIAIGVHALFGFFLAGLMLGESRLVKEDTRQKTEAMMESIFVPIFFAGIGLRLDFASNFNIGLVALCTFGGLSLRFGAAWLATTIGKLPKPHRLLFGLLNIPGGEFQVIVGIIALEAKLISPELFVAIVSGALISSLVAGPLFTLAFRKQPLQSILDFLPANALIHDLKAYHRNAALAELSKQAASYLHQEADWLLGQILERENLASTALGRGLAFPHVRIKGLSHSLVIPARCPEGINDWENPDGRSVRLLFLIVTPSEQHEAQLAILGHLVRRFSNPQTYEKVLHSPDEDSFYKEIRQALLHSNLQRQ